MENFHVHTLKLFKYMLKKFHLNDLYEKKLSRVVIYVFHRVFRAGMLNVTVSSLTGEEHALVRTIVVHENYRQQSPDISPTVEANNIGKHIRNTNF